ncbi:hypothetical protein [Pseudonocardia sp.]|uniref:hypothetical protein n=1 Tax=Pseudonocardia sp. TaxID=60912 RepID=UPI00260AB388|nr:hypothetical protein [Pseudonocardia sp.]
MEKIRMTLTLLVMDLIGRLGARLGPVDERGGGRNTDEGFHISGGAIVAGVIAAGVGAFIAQKVGALGE